MKQFKLVVFILIALCSLLTTSLSAQWLETTIPVRTEPCALVWNAQNNKVYCAHKGNSMGFYDTLINVIDGVTNQVITTVRVGMYPFAFVWNSQNNKVYCASLGY